MLMVHVNGKDYEVEQDTKLMRFLRDDLRLTSVKDGCSQGACGTCTVLVDGSHKGMYSNAFQAAGKICSHSGRAE